jgi:hypothetical protein
MSKVTEEDPFHSRKYRMALLSLLLVTGAWVVAGLLPGFAQVFSELTTGIMGILMLYFTGNVSNKFVVGRQQAKVTKGDKSGTNE